MKDIKNLNFNERAKLFKEAVMKAEKKYGVSDCFNNFNIISLRG